MHIYDPDNEKVIDNVTLYLTPAEAKEIYDDLKRVMDKPRGNHAHISSADLQREITICIYREEDLDTFDEKSKEILLETKKSSRGRL
ncbi:MAG: hypothetical protein GKR87_04255 [Kiritimatiellae bacterium]|nr:hypothetical protein [Kiritimatiellia bacterium]